MPVVSKAQNRFMRGVAAGSIKGKGKPSKAVAREFVAATHGKSLKGLPNRIRRRKSK
jgi:hypothetical protein